MKMSAAENWQEHPVSIRFRVAQEGDRHGFLSIKDLLTLRADFMFKDHKPKEGRIGTGLELQRGFKSFLFQGCNFAPEYEYQYDADRSIEKARTAMWERSVCGLFIGDKVYGDVAVNDYGLSFNFNFEEPEEIRPLERFMITVSHAQPIACVYRGYFWGKMRKPIQ
jgi:hypothetical protein